VTEARRLTVWCRGLRRAAVALVILVCFALAGVEGAVAAEAGSVPLPQAVLPDGDGLDADQLRGLHPSPAPHLAFSGSRASVHLPSPASRPAALPEPAAPSRVPSARWSLRGPPSR